jgi:hypothetical protein
MRQSERVSRGITFSAHGDKRLILGHIHSRPPQACWMNEEHLWLYQSGEREVPHGLFNVSEQLSGE